MNKILIILLTITINIFAANKTIDATYKISYGILGELGLAKTKLKILENNLYKMSVHVYATGFAKILSGQKEEFYESTGFIKDNKLVPKKFIKITKSTNKNTKKEYSFDYEKNKIFLYKEKNKRVTKLNENMETTETWEKEKSYEENSFFVKNDLLSLFFNIKQLIPNFDRGSSYKLYAIGANKTDGKINIFVPNDERYTKLQEVLDTKNSTKFIAAINQKIFSSKNGELFISLNNEGFCNKAVLKDVIMFGDITGEMIDFNIKEFNENTL